MKRKIIAGFILLIILSSMISGIIASKLIENHYLESVKTELINYNTLLSESLKYFVVVDDELLNELTQTLGEKSELRLTFIGEDGNVLGDTDAIVSELDNHKYREEIKLAFEGEIGVVNRYSTTLKTDMLYVAMPYERDGKISVIRASVPLKDINSSIEKLFQYLLVGAFVGIILSTILGYYYVKSIIKPVGDLIDATKDISTGNYGKQVYLKRKDELSTLANHFNIMSETLETKMMELKTNNKEMDTILESMKSGVVAIDNEKKIIFLNKTVEKLFKIKEVHVRGKSILDVLRNYQVEDFVVSIIQNEIESFEDEIVFENNRIYQIHSRAMYGDLNGNQIVGVLLLFEDITEFRSLERIRQDFVANVSHELKTPLTSIKGFAETLKNGAMDNKELREKFIDIIDVEAARIISLTEDLLSLSEIEANTDMLRVDEINVYEVVDEVMGIFVMLADEKNIRIERDLEEELPKLIGNANWFKQLLINLVDNAIKYTSENGKIKVKVINFNGDLVLKVSDSGIGISQQYLGRIFERFYRVDKARSRQEGGTGLGLSIVKHIVIAFNGRIEVESQLDKGTTFTVSIPYER